MHYLLYIIFWFPSVALAHPFHVSVCEITYKEESKTVQITQKIFLDDLENALNLRYDKSFDVLNPKNEEDLDAALKNYLKENFSLFIDGQKYLPTYLGKEIQADAMWCYMEVEKVEKFSSVTVENSLLLVLFDDQTNLVHIEKGDQLKSLRLYEDEEKGTLSFK